MILSSIALFIKDAILLAGLITLFKRFCSTYQNHEILSISVSRISPRIILLCIFMCKLVHVT